MTAADLSEAPAGPGHNRPPEPTLPERLAETYAAALTDLDALAATANKLPKEATTDEERDACAEGAADAATQRRALDAARIAEKAPFLKGEREVDGFFRDPLARADRIEKALTQRVTIYNRAKKKREDDARAESERQAREEAAEKQRLAEEAMAAGRTEDAMADLADAAKASDVADDIAQAPPIEPEPVRTATGVTITPATKWTFEITDLAKVDLEALRPFIKPDAIEAAIRAFVRINKGGRQITGVRIFEDDTAKIRR
jgi:hypothetical protein